MGNFLSSLFGSSQTTQYQPPEELKSAVTDLLKRAGTQSQQPYPFYTPQTAAQYSAYTPGLVAPMTPNQAAAGQSLAGLQGYTAPNFAAATGLAGAAAAPIQLQQFGPQSINQYMSPYLSNVLGSAVANINQTNAQQQQQVLGNAIQKGAFGGDRAGIAQAELARQQALANNATIANILNQGYGQAQQQFNTQQAIDAAAQLQNRQLMSNAALNLANLGTQGQQAAIQQAQAQYGYGTAEQQQQQAGLSTAYQQFLNQYAYPYQQLGWYSQLASGTAPALGGATVSNAPTTSPLGIAVGGLMGLGALSNPSMQSNNPFAYLQAGTSAAGNFFGNIFGGSPYKKGGRVGFAEGGVPVTAEPDPTNAYNEYVGLLSSNAPLPQIRAAYQRYLDSFKGAKKPWEATTAVTATKADLPAEKAAPASAATGAGGGGGGGAGLTAARIPDYERSDIGTKAYPQGGREIIEGAPLEVGQNQTLNALLKGNAPLLTGDYPRQNVLGDLGKGLGQALSLMSPLGILSALNRDPKVVAEEMGKMYGEPNRVAAEAYDDAGNRIDFPNTASGQNLAEYMDQMKISDPSEVRMGMTQVNGRWQPEFFKDSTIGRMLHPNSVPALDVPGVTYGSDSASRQAETGFAIPGSEGELSRASAGKFMPPTEPYTGEAVGSGKTGFAGKYAQLQHDLEVEYSLPEGTLAGIANVETGGTYDPNAYNRSGSAGLMQFQKGTAADYGLNNPYSPEDAMRAAARLAADIANKQGEKTSAGLIGVAHNQGIGGYGKLVGADPNAKVIDILGKNFVSNRFGLPMDATVGEFLRAASSAYQKGAIPAKVETDTSIPLPTARPPEMGGVVPSQRSDSAMAQQAERYDIGNIGRQVSDASAAQQAQRYDIGNIGRQVSEPNIVRAFEAAQDRGGGRDRDTSMDRGGLYSEPAGPSMSDFRGGSDSDSGRGAFSSSYNAREQRGGRIHKAAAGGITMQYGLPTEEDLQRMAQSFAGSGAGTLPVSATALAAKGVLPSKNGGRIHAANGVGVTPDDRKSVTLGEALGEIPSAIGDYITSSKGPTRMGGRFGERPAVTMTTPGGLTAMTGTPSMRQQAERDSPFNAASTAPTVKQLTGDEFKVPEKTQPVVPKADQTTAAAPAAAAAPQRDVAPGIQQFYNAPPPADLRNLAALNFAARMMSPGPFGVNLANAANAYAQNILAQQEQQRSQMTSEATAAGNRASAQKSMIDAAISRVRTDTPTPTVISGGGAGPIEFEALPPILPGQRYVAGQKGIEIAGQPVGETPTTPTENPAYAYRGQDFGAVLPNESQDELNKAITKMAIQRLGTVTNWGMAQKNREITQAYNTEAQDGLWAAQQGGLPLHTLTNAVAGIDQKGGMTSGPTAPTRYAILGYLNDAAKLLNVNLGINETMKDAEIMDKIRNTASQLATQGNSKAARWLETIASTFPNISMQLGTMNTILANMYTQAYTDRVYAQFADKYINESSGQGTDVREQFSKLMPPQKQTQIKDAVLTLLESHQEDIGPDGKSRGWIRDPDTGRYENLVSAYLGGKLSTEAFNKRAFEITGIKNMSSIIGGKNG